MIRLRNMMVMLSILGAIACTENNIGYDEVVNVPEGVYLSGASSEFSLPIETGRLKAGTHRKHVEYLRLVETQWQLSHLLCG